MQIRERANYVVVGLQPFDSPIGSNCVNIAKTMAKHNKVLYVNYPLDTATYLKQRKSEEPYYQKRMEILAGKRKELEQVNDNLWVLTPKVLIQSIGWLPDGGIYDFFNRRNNKKVAERIQFALRELKFEDFLLFNDSDMFRSFYLKEMLKPQSDMYYSRDNLTSQPYFAKHGKRLEPKLIAKADVATANSLYLRDYCRQHNPHSFYVGQGCETQSFRRGQRFERPADLPSAEKPLIGYIGALLEIRLDIQLLENLAAANPQWNFAMVGPEDEAFKNSKLHQQENVFFTGSKKPEELPQYLNFFDVALNPQALNELTIGNYPRKIDEYLAMGKPTVATKTRAMEIFEEQVYLAENEADYQSFIERALAENSEEKESARSAFAQGHTWEASVEEIYQAFEKVKN